jgi:hypothetical protein
VRRAGRPTAAAPPPQAAAPSHLLQQHRQNSYQRATCIRRCCRAASVHKLRTMLCCRMQPAHVCHEHREPHACKGIACNMHHKAPRLLTFDRRMCCCGAGKQRGRGHCHRLAPAQLQLLLVEQHAIQLLLCPSGRATRLQRTQSGRSSTSASVCRKPCAMSTQYCCITSQIPSYRLTTRKCFTGVGADPCLQAGIKLPATSQRHNCYYV